MVYITIPINYAPKQITWEMVLKNINVTEKINTFDTRTFCRTSDKDYPNLDKKINHIIYQLSIFNARTQDLRKANMQELYSSYNIPKHSGGVRRIDNPCPELKEAQSTLKNILEQSDCGSYHTCAFAYIPRRSIVMCRKKHANNKSKWYLYTDFSNFFGSITFDFTINMLKKIFPFNRILQNGVGEIELKKALSLCFLNGGLPQGSPISPMLTNLVMIPIDYQINKYINTQMSYATYTRYADDICVSCRNSFNYKKVISKIEEILQKENAPFGFNNKKTHYINTNWQNFNLGILINKDGNMTIGWKKKQDFKNLLHSFVMSKDDNGRCTWALKDVQYLQGIYSYYKSIESEAIEKIITTYNNKFHCDIKEQLKVALKYCV